MPNECPFCHPLCSVNGSSMGFSTEPVKGGSFEAAANGSSGGGGEGVQLPKVPFSDWELRPEDIQICSHPDGRPWELGTGAFGQVQPNLFKNGLSLQTGLSNENAIHQFDCSSEGQA